MKTFQFAGPLAQFAQNKITRRGNSRSPHKNLNSAFYGKDRYGIFAQTFPDSPIRFCCDSLSACLIERHQEPKSALAVNNHRHARHRAVVTLIGIIIHNITSLRRLLDRAAIMTVCGFVGSGKLNI